jgi:hypothetical protein
MRDSLALSQNKAAYVMLCAEVQGVVSRYRNCMLLKDKWYLCRTEDVEEEVTMHKCPR